MPQVSTIEQWHDDRQVSDSPLMRYIVALVLINLVFGSLIAWFPWSVESLRLTMGKGRPSDQQR